MDEGVLIHVLKVPGRALREGLRATWNIVSGAWMQYDDQVEVDCDGYVVAVGGNPLDPARSYAVGTSTRFGILLSPPLARYIEEHPQVLPPEDAARPVQTLLLS